MTITEAKRIAKSINGRFPRCGHETCVKATELPCGCNTRTWLRNTSGTFDVRESQNYCYPHWTQLPVR